MHFGPTREPTNGTGGAICHDDHVARRDEPSEAGHLCDVEGVRVGHHARASATWRTGTTVVLLPEGTVGGVDVRGGAPGTRETDLLAPDALMNRVDAVCLSGGSAFGLAAADGVMQFLAERRVGFRVGDDDSWVVPIVPSAVIFDLGRAGRFDHRPDREFGHRAARRASTRERSTGSIGAGTGARSGSLQGGVGSASRRLTDGTIVASLVVVNSVGSVVDPESGLPWESRRFGLRAPSERDRRRLREHLSANRRAVSSASPLNTTIGVVITDARLDKAECQKMAAVAHDGLARAIRPAHSLHDGDTVFGLATGRRDLLPRADARFAEPITRSHQIDGILEAAADTFATACTSAVVTARSLGGPPSYSDLVPSAFRR